jgi:predicted TPR repeat methyltransferase
MSGWLIGFVVGALVVVVVVALLVLMIAGARAAAGKAEAILSALRVASDNTAGLWRVRETNATATRIVEAATSARQALEAQPSSDGEARR